MRAKKGEKARVASSKSMKILGFNAKTRLKWSERIEAVRVEL